MNRESQELIFWCGKRLRNEKRDYPFLHQGSRRIRSPKIKEKNYPNSTKGSRLFLFFLFRKIIGKLKRREKCVVKREYDKGEKGSDPAGRT